MYRGQIMDLDYLDGVVSSVVFRNEENGYTVLRLSLSAAEDEITVVGCMPGIFPGEGLTAHGKFELHGTYGRQFKAELVERRMPEGEEEIFRYLASGAIRGIGAVTARRLVERFGRHTLRVIEETPDSLTEIRGITPKRAQSLSHALKTLLSMRRLLDFLAEHSLPLQAAIPLYKRFGDVALQTVRNNPYLLADVSVGAPFSTADQLALSIGFEQDSLLRLEAGLLFELQHNGENGHVFLPRNKLLAATAQLLNVDTPPLSEALDLLLDRGDVVFCEIAGEEACYLTQLYDYECYVSSLFAQMADTAFYPPEHLEILIEGIQQRQNIRYAPLQIEAVCTAACRQIMLLTGGPGTGKTTCLRGVLALFDSLGLRTALAAPTGRAAKRLSETCGGAEASTIHRLLGTCYDAERGQLTFSHNEDDPLEVDAIIVDEISMVDLPLMYALLAAMRRDCRLILVGDPHQLPSVGPGNVLNDLLRSQRIPHIQLQDIFRQAAQSSIVRNAHAVNAGQAPDFQNSPGCDFFFLRRTNPGDALETILDLCQRRLPENMGITPEQIQVLSPTRKGLAGTVSLNQALQQGVNPPEQGLSEHVFGNQLFRVGDRVMQVKNNYDLIWQDRHSKEFGIGVFNGDIGKIESIDPKGLLVTVDFEGHLASYPPDLLSQLELAYATTVHKAQGSEYRAVILCAVDAAAPLLTRGVLYTAITRARELLILVGDEGVVTHMAKNDRPQRRYSGLRARLVQSPLGGDL